MHLALAAPRDAPRRSARRLKGAEDGGSERRPGAPGRRSPQTRLDCDERAPPVAGTADPRDGHRSWVHPAAPVGATVRSRPAGFWSTLAAAVTAKAPTAAASTPISSLMTTTVYIRLQPGSEAFVPNMRKRWLSMSQNPSKATRAPDPSQVRAAGSQNRVWCPHLPARPSSPTAAITAPAARDACICQDASGSAPESPNEPPAAQYPKT